MATSAKAPTKGSDKGSSTVGLYESDEERDSKFDGANADNDQDDDELAGEFGGTIDDEGDDELDDEFDGADLDNDDDDEEDTSVDKGDSLVDPNADDTEADLAAMLKARLGTSNDDDDDDDDDDEETEAKRTKRAPGPRRQLVAEENDDITVQPRQSAEWVCATCFLIVNKAAAAASSCPHCGADRAAFAPA